MKNVNQQLLEFTRLDRKRTDGGLSIPDLERWFSLRRSLDHSFGLRDRSSQRRTHRSEAKLERLAHDMIRRQLTAAGGLLAAFFRLV